jgi:hypothetical protein
VSHWIAQRNPDAGHQVALHTHVTMPMTRHHSWSTDDLRALHTVSEPTRMNARVRAVEGPEA